MGLLDKLKKFNRDHDPNKVDRSKLGKGTRKVSSPKKKAEAPKVKTSTKTKKSRPKVTEHQPENQNIPTPKARPDGRSRASVPVVKQKKEVKSLPHPVSKAKPQKRKSSGALNMVPKGRKYKSAGIL
jgi:hypothetical protein